MNPLIATAQALMAPGKGLPAMDESVGTCNRRLAEFGIAQTEESRRRYRELLVTTPGLSESISGAILQEAQTVPIVEPEVLMDGEQTLARCAEVTADVLHAIFEQLHRQGVALEAMLLKPNMVLPGLACAEPVLLDDVVDATLNCLLRAVPAAVAGIAFLSGGQPAESATARLNAMHLRSTARGPASTLTPPCLPWLITFSVGRALQHQVLSLWAGNDENGVVAQGALLHRARCNAAATKGAWRADMAAEGMPV